MNKIITINLGGIAIDIEEDAYELLRGYLLNVKNHFKGTENGAEIVDDIESRIAEMLFDKLKDKKVSINVADVESVAGVMGQPSDFEEEEETPNHTQSESGRKVRRLFRDPDEAILGGVIAGLAKYLGIEVTILRIIWIIFVLIGGSGAAVYIILWAIIPKAITAAEKLQMTGAVPNIENITNSIRDEAGQAFNSLKKKTNSKKAKAFRTDVESFLIKLFRFVLKVATIIAVIVLLGVLIASVLYFFTGESSFNMNFGLSDISDQLKAAMGGSGLYWLIKGAVYCVFILPIIYILFRAFSLLLNFPSPSSNLKRGFWGAWLMAALTGITGVVYGVSLFKEKGTSTETIELHGMGNTIEIKANNTRKVHHYAPYAEFDIEPTEGEPYLEIVKKSRGRNNAEASELASKLPSNYKLNTNSITIDERLNGQEEGNHSRSEISFTLYLPENHTVILHKNTSKILHHIDNIQNIYAPKMAGKTFRMESTGLNCLDCEEPLKSRSNRAIEGYHKVALDRFDHAEISDAFTLKIIEDGTASLEIPNNSEWAEHIEYSVDNDQFNLELNDEIDLLFDWPSEDFKIPLILHASGLKSIEGNGACKIDYIGINSVMDLYVELNGASSLNAKGLKLDNLQIESNGASRMNLSGEVDLLELETAGASSINAEDLIADYLRLDVGGASTCKVHVLKEISGDIAGASKIRYKGNPKVNTVNAGFVNIEKM